jgi:peptide deformylase
MQLNRFMSVYEIVQYPDKRLSMPGKRVEEVTPEIRRIVENMFETHYAAPNCAALAATQLGIPLCITVIDFSEQKNQPLCLINPEVISGEGETFTAEGCMSVAKVHERVKRFERVTVRAMDLDGKVREYVEEGFMAKCMQHEIDHLNGILFIDRLSALKRKIINLRFRRG